MNQKVSWKVNNVSGHKFRHRAGSGLIPDLVPIARPTLCNRRKPPAHREVLSDSLLPLVRRGDDQAGRYAPSLRTFR